MDDEASAQYNGQDKRCSLHVCQTMLIIKHHLTSSVDDIMDSKQVNDCRDTLITAGRTYSAYW